METSALIREKPILLSSNGCSAALTLMCKASFILLVFSTYFIPFRIFSFRKLFVVGLAVISVPWIMVLLKSFRKNDAGLILFPYAYCFFSFILSAFFFYGSHSDVVSIFLIVPGVLVGLFAYSAFFSANLSVLWGVRVVVWSGFLLSVVCVFQYFDFMRLNDVLYPKLHELRGIEYLSSDSKRAIGLYGNPNEVGLVLGLSFCCLFLIGRCVRSFEFMILFPGLLAGILSTGSRTAIVAVLAVLSVFYVLEYGFRGVIKFSLFLFALSFFAVFFVISSSEVSYFVERATNLRSLEIRFESLWFQAYRLGLEYPFFGHGIAKDIFDSGVTTDSKWLTWWIQLGVIGVFLFVFYFVFLFFWFYKDLKYRSSFWLPGALGFVASLYFFVYAFVVDFGFPVVTPMSILFMIVLGMSLGGRRLLRRGKLLSKDRVYL